MSMSQLSGTMDCIKFGSTASYKIWKKHAKRLLFIVYAISCRYFTLYHTKKISYMSTLDAFADDNSNMADKLKLVSTISQTALVFMCLKYKSFANTVGKAEIARNEQFLLFPQCFLPFWRTSCHFCQILTYCLRSLSVSGI